MKILVTGRSGQVGWELNRCLLPLGEVVAVDYPEVDFSKPEGLRTVVREIRPDVIVNAAAYTAVDKADSEEELATLINAVAPGVLAEGHLHVGQLEEGLGVGARRSIGRTCFIFGIVLVIDHSAAFSWHPGLSVLQFYPGMVP